MYRLQRLAVLAARKPLACAATSCARIAGAQRLMSDSINVSSQRSVWIAVFLFIFCDLYVEFLIAYISFLRLTVFFATGYYII
jgi:hypothetical protein